MIEDRGLAALRALAEPIVAEMGADIYDIERLGAVVRLSVRRAGGVDLDTITEINRQLSRAIDEHDPIAGAFTLEVSSPGLERRLRTAGHWADAVGDRVKVKFVREIEGARRVDGVVIGISDGLISLSGPGDETLTIDIADIETAKTEFDWGPSPKPGGPPKRPSNVVPATSRKTEVPSPEQGSTR